MGDDPLPFEKVSIDDAKKTLDVGALPPKVEEGDWRWARKWSPPEPVKEPTAAWLRTLPAEARPVDLPQAYPRIANRLATIWADPVMCDRCFDELLTDRRGRRSGFPPDVLAELKTLRQFRTKGIESNTVWDATHRR